MTRVHRFLLNTAAAVVAAGLAGVPGSRVHADEPPSWRVNTWPNGRIPFRFATVNDRAWDGSIAVLMDAATKNRVRAQMLMWETAVSSVDPVDGVRRSAIDFVECGVSCPEAEHVVVRMNSATESNNMCTYFVETDNDGNFRDEDEHVGRNPGRATQFHMEANDSGGVMLPGTTRATTDSNTIRHELGHCLGLWHEQNREDRDAWLNEEPDADTEQDWLDLFDPKVPLREADLMPLLGNYDYDSIMHYKSRGKGGVRRWRDRGDLGGNEFSRSQLSNTVAALSVSPRDVSRVLQYYARQAFPNWGFFESLATPWPNTDSRPNASLAAGVNVVGTPAVAWQSEGNYDIFARGSDDRIYWKWFRTLAVGRAEGSWTSLGCCFASDPSAVSPAYGHVEVVAIGAESRRPVRKRLLDGAWGQWLYVGADSVEIAGTADDAPIGPAIASRPGGLLDVFVVLESGNLAVSTRVAGRWTPWTEFATNVDITARPAALGVSATAVRLAVTADDTKLYEPLVTFDATTRGPTASFGTKQANTWPRTAPALSARAATSQSYRVLIVNQDGRVAHKFQSGAWRDIGGIPFGSTGVSAVGDGAYGALIVMHGEAVRACNLACVTATPQPDPNGYIQSGGVWLRRFY
jgi:hypothetical protein